MRAGLGRVSWIGVVAVAGGVASCGGGGGGSPWTPYVVITTEALPSGLTGQPYVAPIEAWFAHPPGHFFVSTGEVPPGLVLDRESGLVSGVPLEVGVFEFEVVAVDGHNPEVSPLSTLVTTRRTFEVSVGRGPPSFLTRELPSASYRLPYEAHLDVVGGVPPYTFGLSGGALPLGLRLDAFVGKVTGAPEETRAEPYEVDVTVTDAEGTQDTDRFSIAVVTLLLAIEPFTLEDAALGLPYSHAFELASPGAGGPYAWSQAAVQDGETDLADVGLEITSSGRLQQRSGVPGPTANGTFAFRVRVEDYAGQVDTKAGTLTVSPPPVLSSITPRKLAAGPYVAKGLGFEPGATLTFGHGLAGAKTIGTTFVDAQTLTFSQPPQPAPATGPVSVQVRNLDGSAGVLVGGFTYPRRLEFRTTPVLPSPNSPLSSTGLDVGDVNKDGFADVVHCGTVGLPEWTVKAPPPPLNQASATAPVVGTSGGIDLLVNAPAAGRFDPAAPAFVRIPLTAQEDWHQVKFADVDKDGDLDVVAVGSTGAYADSSRTTKAAVVRTYLNPFPAPFTPNMAFVQGTLPNVPTAYSHVSDLAVGTITKGDTLPDLAYVHQDSGGQTLTGATWDDRGGRASTASGTGTGAFSAVATTSTLLPGIYTAGGVAVGRLDGDAQADVAVSDQSVDDVKRNRGAAGAESGAVFSLTSGSNLFGAWQPLLQGTTAFVGCESLSVAVGDVTGDGFADVVYAVGADGQEGAWGGTPGLCVMPGDGAGGFGGGIVRTSPTRRLRYLTLLDGDDDLALDLAVTSGAPDAFDKVEIYRASVTGAPPALVQTLTVAGAGVAAPNVGRIASGDFDRDGKPDVCACMSFFADARRRASSGLGHADRGDGVPQGVVIFLNTSQ